MNMKYLKSLLLAGFLATAGFMTGCADGDGSDDLIDVVNGGGGNSNCESDDSVLDGAQCTVTELTDDLAAILNGTPLEPFIQCVDPLANNLVDGPDSVLQTLLEALATQNPDPAAFQAAIMDLATALASLGTNLPNALLALSGDDAAIAACVNGTGGGGGGDPLDPDQLAALCAIPAVGPVIVEAAGGSCDGGSGGTPSLAALCAIPTLGPALVEATGGTCSGTPSDNPLDPGQLAALCAVPVLGPAVLNGIQAGTCP